jgi:hypothetical protein
MKYSLLLYADESAMAHTPPAVLEQVLAAFNSYIQALKDAGVFVATDWLKPSHMATTITLKDGGRRVQDGPFADSKEQLGGFFLIDVPSLDAALAWAERCPAARMGTVEVRPSNMS